MPVMISSFTDRWQSWPDWAYRSASRRLDLVPGHRSRPRRRSWPEARQPALNDLRLAIDRHLGPREVQARSITERRCQP
jgi:hypothetical protein